MAGAHSIGSINSAFLFGKELSGLALRRRMVAVTVKHIGPGSVFSQHVRFLDEAIQTFGDPLVVGTALSGRFCSIASW